MTPKKACFEEKGARKYFLEIFLVFTYLVGKD